VTGDGKSHAQASVTLSKEDMGCHIRWRAVVDTISISHLPVHIYNFDFISLNVALRYWTQPEGEITLGILQPDFDPNPDALLRYDGTVLLDFIPMIYTKASSFENMRSVGRGCRAIPEPCGYTEVWSISRTWTDFKFRLVSYPSMDEPSWRHFLHQEIWQLKPME
jgi:hypothetical protein